LTGFAEFPADMADWTRLTYISAMGIPVDILLKTTGGRDPFSSRQRHDSERRERPRR
jgi:hypothetical protein